MTVGSLFSGIGGFDLGFERAGFDITWQVEIDDYANRVLAKHWPHVARYRDVRECGAANLAPVDVICGGFPCQPHSLAGRRLASADERDLWGEFARIIREIRPRWVVAENVSGLLSSEAGRFFGRVLGDLAACGYDAEWDCLPASAFGAPHQRDRVWIVAYPAGGGGQRRRAGGQQAEGRGAFGLSQGSGYGPADVADAASRARQRQAPREARHAAFGCEDLADADAERQLQQEGRIFDERRRPGDGGWWSVEPNVGRVAHGIPARAHRLRALGNAIVPQIAEWIAGRILEAEERHVA